MRQVAAVGEPHAEDAVAGFQRRQKHRRIRLRARVRLHIGVTGLEQFLGALDRQPLGNVDVFAAAVVTLAGITLGVFVGQHRTLRRQYCGAGVVLRSNQLDVVFLSLCLLLNRVINIRVDGLETVGKNGHGHRYSGRVTGTDLNFNMGALAPPPLQRRLFLQ